MLLFDSISVPEDLYPMDDVDEYGKIKGVGLDYIDGQGRDAYCRRAAKRLDYALSGGQMSPAMYRRLRDDYISAVGFIYTPLYQLRETYIKRWIDLYDTSVWTYAELCYFLREYTKRDVRAALHRYGYEPESTLTEWLNSRIRRVNNDIARFTSRGDYDYSNLQFTEDYIALLIKDKINNRYFDEYALCHYIVSLNQF
jgi:hypothetical protein